MIPEPEAGLRYNALRPGLGYDDDPNAEYVFPGRLYKLNGDPLYLSLLSVKED